MGPGDDGLPPREAIGGVLPPARQRVPAVPRRPGVPLVLPLARLEVRGLKTLTTEQAVERLGVSDRQVRRLIARGRLRGARGPRGARKRGGPSVWRVSREDVDRVAGGRILRTLELIGMSEGSR